MPNSYLTTSYSNTRCSLKVVEYEMPLDKRYLPRVVETSVQHHGPNIRRLLVMKMLLPMLPNRATKTRAEKGQMMTPRRHCPLGETRGTVWPPGEKLELARAVESDHGRWCCDAKLAINSLLLLMLSGRGGRRLIILMWIDVIAWLRATPWRGRDTISKESLWC